MTIFIGISAPNSRIEAIIQEHGATPVQLNYSLARHNTLHGIIIPGNKYDVSPHLYGEEAHPETTINPNTTRTNFEIALIQQSYRRRIPLLAICGGAQLLNVVFGGTLTQHLPDHSNNTANHRQPEGTYYNPAHSIRIAAGSLLDHIGATPRADVNSDHHQAVDKIGRGLLANTVASDGIIEGIEHGNHPFLLGVQWHPEYQISSLDKEIFSAFLRSAAHQTAPFNQRNKIVGGHHE